MGFEPDGWDADSLDDSKETLQERDRRVNRSSSRQEALGYQLRYTQQELSLDAMVLCDDFGEVVASAGSRRVIEGLATQVPWLIATPPAQFGRSLGYMWEVCPNIDEDQIVLCTVSVQGKHEPLILCGIGQVEGLEEGVAHVATGVDRIIRTTLN